MTPWVTSRALVPFVAELICCVFEFVSVQTFVSADNFAGADDFVAADNFALTAPAFVPAAFVCFVCIRSAGTRLAFAS